MGKKKSFAFKPVLSLLLLIFGGIPADDLFPGPVMGGWRVPVPLTPLYAFEENPYGIDKMS